MSRGRLKARLLAFAGRPALHALGATWKVVWHGLENEQRCLAAQQPYLWAFQHGRLLLAAWAGRGRRLGVMISRHGDGEIIASVAEKLGFTTFRGSTTRGGRQALLEMCRVPADLPLAITPDGPRGPRGAVQPGVVLLAQRSERIVIPSGLAAAPAWRARSWDRMIVPKPFARIHVVFGPGLEVPAELDRDGRRDWSERIRSAIEEAEKIAWDQVFS